SSVDGQRILELTQWQSQASYDSFQSRLAEEDSADYTKYYEKYTKDKGKSSLVAPTLLSQSSFLVDQAVAPPGMVPVIEGQNALVQVSELVAEAPEHDQKLRAAAIATLANLPNLYPAPRSAIVLKGISSPALTLITNWGTTNEFSSPDQVPTLSLDLDGDPASSLEGDPVTDWFTREDRLYQMVKVIAPKSEKYEKN
ncbi:MAG TPA: hypothetical protein IGR64_08865, partial [Leptolyngbyaceae cyanobacterium M65_K2018_010]|nr:hypothetical protein [Leptolyngbyaceae cyanobacterium M65_K2018_010]